MTQNKISKCIRPRYTTWTHYLLLYILTSERRGGHRVDQAPGAAWYYPEDEGHGGANLSGNNGPHRIMADAGDEEESSQDMAVLHRRHRSVFVLCLCGN